MKKYLVPMLMLLSFNTFAENKNTLNDIHLKDLDNNIVTLDKYKGKNIYVKMWASWCPICLVGLAEIDELSVEPDKGFEIITIVSPGRKGEKPTEKFIEWYKGLEYKNVVVLLDEEGEVLKKGKVRGYPSSLILDAELNIKKSVPGHLTAAQIREMVK